MFLTDEQWETLRPVLEIPRKSKRGRPRRDAREVFEAILFVLHTGMQWRFLPKSFPPKSTVHDYLSLWSQKQAFRDLFVRIVRQLIDTGKLDLNLCFIDATFSPAKGGGAGVGLTRKGKGTKVQLCVDRKGVPFALGVDAADVGEPQLVQETMQFFDETGTPVRLVGDKAYDCDALDIMLEDLGVDMIAPHRKNRKPENKTQDGRKLKPYRHRWIVERTIAWLQNHRRLLARHEKKLSHFVSFTLLGCLMIAMRHLPAALC
jgi:transposase